MNENELQAELDRIAQLDLEEQILALREIVQRLEQKLQS